MEGDSVLFEQPAIPKVRAGEWRHRQRARTCDREINVSCSSLAVIFELVVVFLAGRD